MLSQSGIKSSLAVKKADLHLSEQIRSKAGRSPSGSPQGANDANIFDLPSYLANKNMAMQRHHTLMDKIVHRTKGQRIAAIVQKMDLTLPSQGNPDRSGKPLKRS